MYVLLSSKAGTPTSKSCVEVMHFANSWGWFLFYLKLIQPAHNQEQGSCTVGCRTSVHAFLIKETQLEDACHDPTGMLTVTQHTLWIMSAYQNLPRFQCVNRVGDGQGHNDLFWHNTHYCEVGTKWHVPEIPRHFQIRSTNITMRYWLILPLDSVRIH